MSYLNRTFELWDHLMPGGFLSINLSEEKMKKFPDCDKILVHAHVFYVRMWTELEECLKNISVPYDLYVTLTGANPDLRRDIRKFKPDADIRIVENRGYDVWPFIDTLNRVNLDDYAYVVKIHTKRDTGVYPVGNGYVFKDDEWRKALLKFLKTPRNFKKCLVAFRKDRALGMISSFDCIHSVKTYPDAFRYARKNYPRYIFGLQDFSFVAGTMFMARASLLKPVRDMKITASLFAEPDDGHSMQFAHIMERTLGEAVYKAGCRIDDPISTGRERRQRQRDYNFKLKLFCLTLFQFKYCRDCRLLLKFLGIPLWSYKKRQADGLAGRK